ncbi:MAG: hypothetical protein M3Q39_01035 [Actinomycetota bacterium]|nr:hypothetical protein [Actinomycetota bacterium]
MQFQQVVDRRRMVRNYTDEMVPMAGSGGMNAIFGLLAIAFFGVLGIPALVWRVATGRPVTVVDHQGIAVDDVRLAGARSSACGCSTHPPGSCCLTPQQRRGWRTNDRRGSAGLGT